MGLRVRAAHIKTRKGLWLDGPSVGYVVEGDVVGKEDGCLVGDKLGEFVGATVGAVVGADVGLAVGAAVGAPVGVSVGDTV